MARFVTFRDAFVSARLTRKANGVLEVALHTNGGKLVFDRHTHEQFVELFHSIGEGRENRVVILTGSGDAFMDTISPEGFDFFSLQGYDKIVREGRKILSKILDIEAPMIIALNGPALLHSEYALLTDIVLATPETVSRTNRISSSASFRVTASTPCGRMSSVRSGAATSCLPGRCLMPRLRFPTEWLVEVESCRQRRNCADPSGRSAPLRLLLEPDIRSFARRNPQAACRIIQCCVAPRAIRTLSCSHRGNI